MVNRRNRPVTLAFCEDLRMPRSEVHLDSACPRSSRVGALIYDPKAGWRWRHNTLCCLSRSWTKATCLCSILGSPVPVVMTTSVSSIIKSIACTFYILLHSTFEYLRWEGQPIHAMPDSEFSSFGAGFGLWFPLQPSAACTTCALGIPDGTADAFAEERLRTSWCDIVLMIGASIIELLIWKYPLRICQVAQGSW